MRESGRQRLHRRIVALLFALIISIPAIWANSETQSNALQTDKSVYFAPSIRVMLFSPSAGQWAIATFGQTAPGNEFYFNNQLYRAIGTDKAEVVPNVDAVKLLEADLQYDKTSRRPTSSDVVQVLDKDAKFVAHAVFGLVPPGATVRFQGRAFNVKSDRSLTNTGIVFSSAAGTLRRIEITRSGMQHVTDRHTVGGARNAGASIFNPGENIQVLIKAAQLTIPTVEANGYFKRVCDAGRGIGFDGRKGKQTGTYFVITTQSGQLVTAYPVVE